MFRKIKRKDELDVEKLNDIMLPIETFWIAEIIPDIEIEADIKAKTIIILFGTLSFFDVKLISTNPKHNTRDKVLIMPPPDCIINPKRMNNEIIFFNLG